MKITYTPNPLFIKIELDENEKKELWYKIKVKELEELIFDAHFHLQEGKYFDLEDAKKTVDPNYYIEKNEQTPSDLDKRCDMLLGLYLEELAGGHAGDCTCFPCSCCKCMAEELIGINTIKGLGKHGGSKILGAFGNNNDKTIDEALEHLKNWKPNAENSQYTQYFEKWANDAKHAYEWLLNYKNTHLKNLNQKILNQNN